MPSLRSLLCASLLATASLTPLVVHAEAPLSAMQQAEQQIQVLSAAEQHVQLDAVEQHNQRILELRRDRGLAANSVADAMKPMWSGGEPCTTCNTPAPSTQQVTQKSSQCCECGECATPYVPPTQYVPPPTTLCECDVTVTVPPTYIPTTTACPTETIVSYNPTVLPTQYIPAPLITPAPTSLACCNECGQCATSTPAPSACCECGECSSSSYSSGSSTSYAQKKTSGAVSNQQLGAATLAAVAAVGALLL